MYPTNGPASEKGNTLSTRHGDAVMDVLFDLIAIEWAKLGVDENSLAELSQTVFGYDSLKFRLTH